jgi:hypothetical protein
MDFDLRDLQLQFEDSLADGHRIGQGLSPAQFNWRPAEGRWSVAECLDHLNVTNRLYLDQIQITIDRARRKGIIGNPPFRYGRIESWFVKQMNPPVKLKLKTPGEFAPTPSKLDRDEVLATWRSQHWDFLDKIAWCEGLHLTRNKVRSPITRFLKFSLGASFALVTAHNRRHLWQAKQILESAEFGAAHRPSFGKSRTTRSEA